MTVCTITIKDAPGDELALEGRIEGYVQGDPLPAPTPALIVASYLAANAQQVSEAAMKWFMRDVPKEGLELEGVPV